MKTIIGLPPAFTHGTAGQIVYVGRCLLVYARIKSAVSTGTLDIYDGVSTGGVKKLALASVLDTCDETSPPFGIIFEQGVYLDVGGGLTDWTVGISPIQEEGGEG
jgi:hypothetical protein